MAHKQVYEKDGKRYGVTEGLFRSRWWNFYERGLSYSDGGYWEDATDDFTEAIKRRDADQRRARTYGLHLIDYFPHRELGISYYRLRMFEDAIRELEKSLATVESSKAQYFLDKARRDLLEITNVDKFPPTISIQYPTDGHLTNAFKIKISGSASDDYFVKTITIGGKSVLINLSEKEIVFKKEVELNVGSNEIMIVAGDLTDKTTTTSINIHVDRQGPQLSIENIRYIDDENRIVECEGYIYDTTGVKEFYLNESRISLNEGEEIYFNERVELNGDEPIISFLAGDFIGNTTQGLIEIRDSDRPVKKTELETVNPVRKYGRSFETLTKYSFRKTSSSPLLTGISNGLNFAFMPSLIVSDAGPIIPKINTPMKGYTTKTITPIKGYTTSTARDVDVVIGPCARSVGPCARNRIIYWIKHRIGRDETPPEIFIKDLTEKQIVYYDTIYIEGSIQDETGIKNFSINGHNLMRGRRQNLFFNYFTHLEPGNNRLNFEAVDVQGNRNVKTIEIHREVPVVRDIGSRFAVSILPFFNKGEIDELGPIAFDNLLTSLMDQGRFNVLDRRRLEEIWREYKLSQSILADPDLALEIGRITVSDAVMIGIVDERPTSIEVYARLIDPETSTIIEEKDAFHEDKGLKNLRMLMEGLGLKFKHAFPLLEGRIVKVNGDEITVELGEEELMKPMTKFIVYREGSVIRHPKTGLILGSKTIPLTEAKIKSVDKKMSNALILGDNEIKITDKVITK